MSQGQVDSQAFQVSSLTVRDKHSFSVTLKISQKAAIKRLTESNLYIPLAYTVMLFVNINIEHLCISLDIFINPMKDLVDSFISNKQCMAHSLF